MVAQVVGPNCYGTGFLTCSGFIQYLMYVSMYAHVLDIIYQQCIIYVYIAEGTISIQGRVIKILNSGAVALLPTCLRIKELLTP